MPKRLTEKSQTILVFSLLVAVKIVGLAVYGPIFLPDGSNFINFADIILQNDSWLLDIGIEHDLWMATSFPAIGYPLVIMVAKIIAGEGWSWLVVGFQLGLSMVSTLFVFV